MNRHKKSEIYEKLKLSGDTYRMALNSALRILTGRDHSKYELTRKLKQRGFKLKDIEKAVLECIRLDYINDERTARIYIRQLIRKGYGLQRIGYELDKKGLVGERIRDIFSESVSDADELEGAERILKKNFNRFERETDLKKRRNKIYRFLYGRGFSQDTIRKLVNNS